MSDNDVPSGISASGSGWGVSRRAVLGWAAAGAGALLLPGTSASATPRRPQADGPIRVWLPGNAVKLRRDEPAGGDGLGTGAPDRPGYEVRLSAAGNEAETAQLILRSAEGTRSVSVSVSPLQGPAGALPAEAVSLYQQHYIQVTAPENTHYPAGWYPDALVPLAPGGTVDLTPDANQGIWVKVAVPAGQPAGDYTGTVTVSGGGALVAIALRLTVHGFSLPDAARAATAFTIWYDQVAWAHGVTAGTPEYAALMDRYYWYQVSQRLIPDDLPIGTNLEPVEYVRLAEPYLSDDRVTGFRIPYYNGDILGKTRELVELLRDRGWLTKGYFYLGGLIDEPQAAKYPLVQQYCQQLRQIAPEVRHIVTTTPVQALADDVQTWCFPFGHYGAPMMEWVREHSHAWWYPLVGTVYPLPSVFIDDNLIGTRLIAWMQHDFGIEGLLYWSTTIFRKWNGSQYVDRDTWADPTGYPNTNGDGFLLYPGKPVGIDGPVATIRMEALREGIEDGEYLRLLDERIAATAADLGLTGVLDPADVTRPLFDQLYTSVNDYTDDPAALERVRAQVVDQIESLPRGLPVLVTFPQTTEYRVVVAVYAPPGSTVRINGVPAQSRGQVGAAERYEARLILSAGLREVDVWVGHGSETKELTRTLLVRAMPRSQRTIPVNSFETDADLARMKLNHVTASRSAERATHGSFCARLDFPANVSWPGVSFDAAAHVGTTDWSHYKEIAFDVDNPNPGVPLVLYAKFHQIGGAADDKHPVWFAPNAANQIHIDLSRVSIDLRQVASLELYSFQLAAPFTLYLDNLRFLAGRIGS
jgi:hypothetical protein